VREFSTGLYAVEIPRGYELVFISDGEAWLTPQGYPPTRDYMLSAKERSFVANNLRRTFGGGGELSAEAIDTVRDAFWDVYKGALLDNQIHLRCSTLACGKGIVAWWGSGIVRLCPLFFDSVISESYAAATLIEELLHGYAGIGHEGTPPVREADFYQTYMLEHYLD
jgi:hypothetical protein